jgi:carboxyl-terminal processing protease
MNDIINTDKKKYKKIINKLIKTIENNGIPDKLKKWNKPKIKYDFENDKEFYDYLMKLSQSYHKHTFTDVYLEDKKTKNNNKKDMKHPKIKMLKNNILYIKFYHYFQNIKGWEKALDEWIKEVKQKIDKQLQKEPKGIIIDLTEHYGGNLWPAIHSMYNIYGDNSLLRFTSEKKWTNIIKEKIKKGNFKSKDLKFTKPIGIIISKNTRSSGELIAATFKGRKNTFFIGDKTNKSGGFMSINSQYPLVKDWSISLILTTSLIETVDGKTHPFEYLKVKSSKDPIKEATEKISKLVKN